MIAEDCELLLGDKSDVACTTVGEGFMSSSQASSVDPASSQSSAFEKGQVAFSGLPLQQQTTLLSGFNDFKEALMEFLARKRAEGVSNISKSDMDAFVAVFKAEKEEARKLAARGL